MHAAWTGVGLRIDIELREATRLATTPNSAKLDESTSVSLGTFELGGKSFVKSLLEENLVFCGLSAVDICAEFDFGEVSLWSVIMFSFSNRPLRPKVPPFKFCSGSEASLS